MRSKPPIINEGPKPSIIHLGRRASFMCKSHGEPRPTVTWFFDGSEVFATQSNNRYSVKIKKKLFLF